MFFVMKTYIWGVILLATGLLASCAANRTAADLAGQTVAEITAYEQAVDNKINAEKGFYASQAAILRGMEGEVPLPKNGQSGVPGSVAGGSGGMSLQDLKITQNLAAKEVEGLLTAKTAAEDNVTKEKGKVLDADADLVIADQALIQARSGDKEQIVTALKVQRDAKEKADAAARALADASLAVDVAKQQLDEGTKNLKTLNKLIDTASQAADATPSAAPAKVDEEGLKIRSSLAYLRIAHASNRDAYALVDELLTSGTPAARSSLMDYLTDGIAEDAQAIERSTANRQRLESEVVKNLAKLEGGKQNLKKAREALVELKKDKTTLDHLKNVLKFGKAARDAAKKNDEASAASTPASTNS